MWRKRDTKACPKRIRSTFEERLFEKVRAGAAVEGDIRTLLAPFATFQGGAALGDTSVQCFSLVDLWFRGVLAFCKFLFIYFRAAERIIAVKTSAPSFIIF